jgi:transcription termination factor Rho
MNTEEIKEDVRESLRVIRRLRIQENHKVSYKIRRPQHHQKYRENVESRRRSIKPSMNRLAAIM